jgi:hypothetical protein
MIQEMGEDRKKTIDICRINEGENSKYSSGLYFSGDMVDECSSPSDSYRYFCF